MGRRKRYFHGGREILIKGVAMAIPTYTMSYFKLPTSFCDEVEKMMARFGEDKKRGEKVTLDRLEKHVQIET